MKSFVISDIHGRFDEFMKVLECAGYSDSDRLIVLGDNIDRGPDSRKVMGFLLELRENKDNIFLKGNHEGWILDMSAGHARMVYTWLTNGEGMSTLKSYGQFHHRIHFRVMDISYEERDENMRVLRNIPLKDASVKEFIKMVYPAEHLEFMQSMLYSYEEGGYFFSHAGLTASVPFSDQRTGDFIYGDEAFIKDNARDYGKILVFGHWHSSGRGFNVGFKRICVAAEGDKVGILNLAEMSYVDSEGLTRQIDPRQLYCHHAQ